MKKILMLFSMAALLVVTASAGQAQETRVGGHLKLNLYDYVDGTHNGIHQTQNGGFLSAAELILFISQEINDYLSVDVQPTFSVNTGATPKLGNDIGAQRDLSKSPSFGGWDKAEMKALLPYEMQLAFGIVKPIFTMEYGEELFWQDELNGSKFAANTHLGAMHESGLELYRDFELGSVSLPVYFYLVNGTGKDFGDNNRHPMLMLHLEPEIGPVKFSGSLAYGKWDASDANDMTRYSAGLQYSLGAFQLRSEFAGGKWAKSIGGVKDAVAFGYYVKLFYRITPWLKAMVDANLADHNFNGFFFTGAGAGEKYTTVTPGLIFNITDSNLLLLQYDIADWRVKDDSDKLQFKRLTLGWRSTF